MTETTSQRSLVVKTTAGTERPEATNQALTVAAAAVAAGVEVSLWLTGESAWFAVPGRAAELELDHAAPAADLLEAVLAAGTVTLCTQCAARRDIGPDDVVPGVRIAGAPVFVEESLRPGAQALVY
ncbi:DsrE family protein [Isoptericola halotolerans]|uniref:DsrE family protein n=1 Tax=Isoptericola halotolerans TaxID=300560 RepID=UPI00388F757F